MFYIVKSTFELKLDKQDFNLVDATRNMLEDNGYIVPKNLEQLSSVNGEPAQSSFYNLANQYMREGNLRSALVLYLKSIDYDPENYLIDSVYKNAGTCARKLGYLKLGFFLYNESLVLAKKKLSDLNNDRVHVLIVLCGMLLLAQRKESELLEFLNRYKYYLPYIEKTIDFLSIGEDSLDLKDKFQSVMISFIEKNGLFRTEDVFSEEKKYDMYFQAHREDSTLIDAAFELIEELVVLFQREQQTNSTIVTFLGDDEMFELKVREQFIHSYESSVGQAGMFKSIIDNALSSFFTERGINDNNFAVVSTFIYWLTMMPVIMKNRMIQLKLTSGKKVLEKIKNKVIVMEKETGDLRLTRWMWSVIDPF